MNRSDSPSPPAVRRTRRNRARTLVEMMIALGVFATATLGIWECIRTVFFLSAKNTGLNLSHTALGLGVDGLSEKLRGSLQILDVDDFDGTTFTPYNEATTGTPTTAKNAVRFLRLIPITVFLLPDDGKTYTQNSPQDPAGLLYPDYLTLGKKTVTGTFTTTASLTDSNIVADLTAARLYPRFPYIPEPVTPGSKSTLPGVALSASPIFSGVVTNATTGVTTGNVSMQLTYGWPTATIPSCNQAYLVIVSAAAVLNRGTSYSELIYYSDVTNLTHKNSLTSALAASTTGSGPAAFALPQTAGPLNDPTARASLQITLPVYAPNLNNTVVRRGGQAALANIELNLPVETRRLGLF